MERKKLLWSCLCLLLLACMVLAGCGQKAQKNIAEDKRQELVFGGDIYPPFVYVDEKAEMAGIDIDIMKEACRRLGYKPVYKTIAWNNKDWLLADGFVDGLWSCFSMNGREQDYVWAGPYMDTHHVIIVGSHSNIKDLADLNGRRMIVQYSSQPEKILLERKDPELPVLHDLYSTNNVDALFSSLQMGYADAAACNEIVAGQYQHMFPGDFVIMDKPLMNAHIGVAFAKVNQKLAEEFNTVLHEMKQDGTTEQIINKYKNNKNKLGGVNASVATRKEVLRVPEK